MGTTDIVGSLISGDVQGVTINTGALVADFPKTIVHNLDLDNYQLEVSDDENNVEVQTLKKDPADPKNKIIVEVAVDIIGGLDISIIGY